MSHLPAIVPVNQVSTELWRQILDASNEEIPIIEMNDQTTRNINVLWASVNDIATRWRGNQDARIPGKPSNRKEFWGEFSSDDHIPLILPVLKKFLSGRDGVGKLAIDLGCNNSPAIEPLLKKGWQVICVDNSRIVLDVLAQKHQAAIASGQLQIVEADIAEFSSSEPADLVIAADSLYYTDPSKFRETWSKIHNLLVKENGFFIGSLYVMRETSDPKQIRLINGVKEYGGWFLPDRRMVKTLLKETGYQIKRCTFRNDTFIPEPICLQFVAQKSQTEAAQPWHKKVSKLFF